MGTLRRGIPGIFSKALTRRIGICAVLLLSLETAAFALVVPPVFSVEVSFRQDSLKTEFFRKTGIFFVDTKIKNISNQNQNIIIWTQQGWSWVSDNPAVAPGIEALKNYPVNITLKPGEEYNGGVEMWLNSRRQMGPVTFRQGFVPRAGVPISANPKLIEKSGGVFWSNAVTLSGEAISPATH